MNERIRELVEQTTDTVEIVNPDTGITHHREFFDKEKFAELIVKECIACSTWVGKMNTNSSEPIQTAHAINQRIKQHFGVEE
jgi:hypothetical protein